MWMLERGGEGRDGRGLKYIVRKEIIVDAGRCYWFTKLSVGSETVFPEYVRWSD